mgnify:CR=1 FL=1
MMPTLLLSLPFILLLLLFRVASINAAEPKPAEPPTIINLPSQDAELLIIYQENHWQPILGMVLAVRGR